MAGYRQMHLSGELRDRVEQGRVMLESCYLCPRCCQVNRLTGEVGHCHVGSQIIVSSYGPRFGEESPLVSRYYRQYQAHNLLSISRPVNSREFREATGIARRYGIKRLDKDHASIPLASP